MRNAVTIHIVCIEQSPGRARREQDDRDICSTEGARDVYSPR